VIVIDRANREWLYIPNQPNTRITIMIDFELTEYTEPWTLWYAGGTIVETLLGSAPQAKPHHKIMDVYPGVSMGLLTSLISAERIEDLADPDYIEGCFSDILHNRNDELYPIIPTLDDLAEDLATEREAMIVAEEELRRLINKRTKKSEELEREIINRCRRDTLYLVEINEAPVALSVDQWGKVNLQELNRLEVES